jgi:hypothetical protein
VAAATSVAVESNDFLFESRTLERHSAARKADAATPTTTMRPPIRAARTRAENRLAPTPRAAGDDPFGVAARESLECGSYVSGTPRFTASPNCDVDHRCGRGWLPDLFDCPLDRRFAAGDLAKGDQLNTCLPGEEREDGLPRN